MAMTLEEIRQAGFEALRKRLGPAGMIRFLQQFDSGSGNYAKERRAWVDKVTFDDIRKMKPKRRPKKK